MSESGFSVMFADGTSWSIQAGDKEAARIIAELSSIMKLQPRGRNLLVTAARDKKPMVNLLGHGTAVCNLFPPTNQDMLVIGMSQLALALVRDVQSRGGVLLHGALAEFPFKSTINKKHRTPGGGILLAGPATVGKTTASNRLPPPWQALSDDAALIVRDPAGQYWAHPWPTWSRFYSTGGIPGPGGSWDVQHAVPLLAVFFLSQSPQDRAEPLNTAAATTMLMEAVQHVSGTLTRHLQDKEIQDLYKEQLMAVETLAKAVPAYTLHISLTGKFWKEIEKVLQADVIHKIKPLPQNLPSLPSEKDHPTVEAMLHESLLYIAYIGPSMNPTLHEPDLLEIRPYDDRQINRGDVIYFQSPINKRGVVHRVVRISSKGIHTRGDNNGQADPYLLKPGDVIGQVVRAQRGSHRRHIAGGRTGRLIGYRCRVRRIANLMLARSIHGLYQALANTGLFQHFLPSKLQPRVFVFKSRNQYYLKLLMGKRIIGKYDLLKQQWHIRLPFHLFLKESELPCPSRDYLENNKATLFGFQTKE